MSSNFDMLRVLHIFLSLLEFSCFCLCRDALYMLLFTECEFMHLSGVDVAKLFDRKHIQVILGGVPF